MAPLCKRHTEQRKKIMFKQISGTSKVSEKPAFVFPTNAAMREKAYYQACDAEKRKAESTIPTEHLVDLQIQNTSSFADLKLMDVFFWNHENDAVPNYNNHMCYFVKVGNTTAIGAMRGSGYYVKDAIQGMPLYIIMNATNRIKSRIKKNQSIEKVVGVYASK